ncbi:hypothetical protein [Listeria sp. ILCC792]|uniref:hypothetical protein n=1 Tax=Listeria sp. ILCC792 TaxID=1918331 RepID=UPI000B58D409|nr:hypothetical protein [Listeria sp. ILCC792]
MNYEAIYEDLRQQALQTTPKTVNLRVESEDQVIASLIDFKLSSRKASLFCCMDGTVSLYFDDALPYLGLGESELVRQAAISYLISAGQTIKSLPKDKQNKSFNKMRIHLLTMEYHQVYVNLEENVKPVKFLDFLIQKIIMEIKKIQNFDLS